MAKVASKNKSAKPAKVTPKNKLDKVADIIDGLGEKWDYPKAYALLDKLNVKIDEDPVSSGMDSMKSKLARVVNYHSLVARMFRRALRNEAVARKRVRVKEEMLKAAKNELLATDEDVQSGRSREDRDSMANLKLKTTIQELQEARNMLTDAETFAKCVKIAADNLVEAREAISRQFSMITQEISLGLVTGDSFSPDV
jgi:hypothetical protein